MVNKMKVLAKELLGIDTELILEAIPLRCTVTFDEDTRTYYMFVNGNERSWGIGFVTKDGYVAQRPKANNLSFGTIGEITYWVSVKTREESLSYSFNVTKGNIVVKTYNVVSVIEEE